LPEIRGRTVTADGGEVGRRGGARTSGTKSGSRYHSDRGSVAFVHAF
jgi:hypothetical protein